MKNKASLMAATLFFIVSVLSLSDYGIIWDAPTHYRKGQSYFRYLFTGKKDYQNLQVERRSFYQSDQYSLDYYLYQDPVGHPSLNDTLASFTNWLFYQQLGLFGDIESYHLFIVFVSSLLVYVVFRFTQEVYGTFAALVATLSLVLYPLFLAESHFNIKDPVETSFYALTIYAFWKGISKNSRRWLLASAIAAGFALGTKFNILFVSLTLFFWLMALRRRPFSKKVIASLVVYPLIMIAILFASSPQLWQQPLTIFLGFFRYYLEIGYGITYQPEEYLTSAGFNTYALQWILYTTPLVILFFACWGILVAALRWRQEPQRVSLLVLLWFLVPVIRVSLPQMGIYGGVRQIMEYIPAMAILAGLGAETLRQKLEKLVIGHWSLVICLLMFLPITIKMIQIHPNQNAYFNPLVGGLKGGQERNIPDWGNSFGNIFRQGTNWLNENVEKGAKLVLAVSYEDAAPKIWLRSDIDYNNLFRSGLAQKGEYVMEMTGDMDWPDFCYWVYVQNFLEPVYEVRVDEVPILKIWKNDLQHSREDVPLSLLTDCLIRDEPGQGKPDFSRINKSQ